MSIEISSEQILILKQLLWTRDTETIAEMLGVWEIESAKDDAEKKLKMEHADGKN